MNGRIAKWIPGMVAIAAIVGFITWLTADSLDTTPISSPAARADLASFDPPACPGAGEQVVPASANEPLFGEAMKYYRAGDFSRASFALQKATGQQPDNPEIRFFLGISYLLTDDTHAGIRELRVAEGLARSPYTDKIHFYLAKAFLRQKDRTNAVRELNSLVAADGVLAESAKQLKFELANVSE